MKILIIILLSLLWISLIVFSIMVIKRLKNSPKPQPVKIDVNLKDFNTFIRREFLFEFIKWIMYAPKTIDVDNGPVKMPSFINDLKNPEVLNEKMTLITTQIISKMSVYLINEFNAVYDDLGATSNEDNIMLYSYVSRQVMFFIRRVDFEITSMFETRTDAKPTDLLKQYVLAIEAEIYKLNNIQIVEEESEIEESE